MPSASQIFYPTPNIRFHKLPLPTWRYTSTRGYRGISFSTSASEFGWRFVWLTSTLAVFLPWWRVFDVWWIRILVGYVFYFLFVLILIGHVCFERILLRFVLIVVGYGYFVRNLVVCFVPLVGCVCFVWILTGYGYFVRYEYSGCLCFVRNLVVFCSIVWVCLSTMFKVFVY